MPRFKAHVAVIEALQKKGLYRGAQNYRMNLPLCSRSKDVVEKMIKPQWYVNCKSMGMEALNAAMDGKLEIIPKQYTAEWSRWLESIHDWCISRQLWWGHRIPAWYVTLEDDELKKLGSYNDHWIVARDEKEALAEATKRFVGKKFEMCQDPDVLDTWFSSSLFPLLVLGWPDETDDLKAFYPNSVLETGHDILFFWVARMLMLASKLGGNIPFRKVYLHPMIRDAHGRKMSKSLGNVIDPIEIINGISLDGLHKRLEEGNLDPKELDVAKAGQIIDFPHGVAECGADALRFALISYTAQSGKINLDIQRVFGYRQWCNKLWNGLRFAMSKQGEDYVPPTNIHPENTCFSCKWILSVLNKAISRTVASLNSYEFSDAASTFCDVFIEAIKPYFAAGDDPAFASERSSARDALWVCLETGLRLLHPFMPFVTEELWQRLPAVEGCTRKESIMLCEYPAPVEGWTNERAEYDLVESTVKCIRSLRADVLGKSTKGRLPAFAICTDEVAEMMRSHELEIMTLASLSSLNVLLSGTNEIPAGCPFETVNENLIIYLKVVQGSVDAEAEREKLKNKMAEIQKQHEKLTKIMSASGYQEKVPSRIQEDNAAKLAKLEQDLRNLKCR
ncbi:hypothetical protein Dsin_029444 [Dipteronia sinensis]|uniref:valine--tRNA ligase n=1 Tax=Dipteronia sinensis TaxID=43782 RepID=A0AAD9ZSD0_9ROSI|nr:hypothetical protein Dsin_029444 [Dipteronia sinensis]